MNMAALGMELNELCNILCKKYNNICDDCPMFTVPYAEPSLGSRCARTVIHSSMEFVDREGLR